MVAGFQIAIEIQREPEQDEDPPSPLPIEEDDFVRVDPPDVGAPAAAPVDIAAVDVSVVAPAAASAAGGVAAVPDALAPAIVPDAPPVDTVIPAAPMMDGSVAPHVSTAFQYDTAIADAEIAASNGAITIHDLLTINEVKQYTTLFHRYQLYEYNIYC